MSDPFWKIMDDIMCMVNEKWITHWTFLSEHQLSFHSEYQLCYLHAAPHMNMEQREYIHNYILPMMKDKHGMLFQLLVNI